MKKIALSLVAVSAIVTTSGFAADTLEGAFKEGKVSGQVRAFYINRSVDYVVTSGASTTDYKRDGLALGGKLAYETAPLYGISMGAAFYTTNKLDNTAYASGANGVQKSELGTQRNDYTLFGSDDKGYTFLGQAYLQGKFSNTTVKVGRQQLDTPLAGSDDAREIPNLFTAALVINTDIPSTTLIGGRVTQIAYGSFANAYLGSQTYNSLAIVSGYGISNGASNTITDYKNGKFQSMGRAALGSYADGLNASDSGVTVVAAINKSISGLTAQAWYYNAENILSAVYAQADYSWKCLLNPNATMTASAQYLKENELSNSGLSSAPYYGVQLATKAGSFNAAVAYSSTGKSASALFNGSIISPWGGMPAFTQGMVTRHQFYSDTTAYKVSAGYNLKDIIGQDITTSAYYCKFNVGDQHNTLGGADYMGALKTNTVEPGFDITYNNAGIKNLQLRLRGNFPSKFYSTTTNTAGWSEYRVIANYNF